MTALAGFSDLSAELLQDIHLLAANSNLPLVNRYARNVLTLAPPSYIARYFLKLYEHLACELILSRSLRHRVVDLDVVKVMIRIWDWRRGYEPDDRGEDDRPIEGSEGNDVESGEGNGQTTHRRRLLLGPPLDCYELPRRLFRDKPKPSAPAINPLIPFLVTTFKPEIDCHQGYALARSALNGNRELVEYLVEHGADPAQRGWMSVQAAIERRDFELVKLLMKVSVEDVVRRLGGNNWPRMKRKIVAASVLELRKPGTDHLVELAMRKQAHEIVEYLVHEQGGMPSLSKIMAMSTGARSPASSSVASHSPRRKRARVEDKPGVDSHHTNTVPVKKGRTKSKVKTRGSGSK